MTLDRSTGKRWRDDARVLYALAGALAAAIFVVDATSPDIAIAVLYVVVVLLVASAGSRRATWVTVCACIALALLAFALSHDERYSGGALARCGVSLFAIVATACLSLRNRLPTDLTERAAAQDALDRSTAELAHAMRVTMLGELAASIAHEVTQPLAAIVTAGDAALRWIDRPEPDLGEARQSVGQMIRDAGRASDVMRQIRAIARKRVPEQTPLDLNAVVRESLGLVRRELDSRRIDVEADYSASPQRVRGERVQLQQVVIHLVMNAVQAMSDVEPGARRLRIRTHAFDERHAGVVVEDSGTGIGHADADRLFSAFFTTREDGMGMGLSICRSIVEAHGGRIWADLRAGPGAVMQFVLPVEEETNNEH
ncbi:MULTISPECIES: ATP-binding protein [unclassified Burkholderia]|uniref:sensor histidine kinase n=1 Tax=unclassified Burkholderia TaxID=2613784 RepID=UPI001FC8AE4B|nr:MULTISPECIES: ATP-binding protein [unclassified Burkholderia]